MNNPNAANTSAHNHASTPHPTHADAGNCAPDTAPTANTTTTDTAPITIARTNFTAMYAAGRNGVSRNCRLHPAARSIDTIAPPLVVASIAAYTAMLTKMYPVTLPPPTRSDRDAAFVPNNRKNTAGITTVNTTVRRLRTIRRNSNAIIPHVNPPNRGRLRATGMLMTHSPRPTRRRSTPGTPAPDSET